MIQRDGAVGDVRAMDVRMEELPRRTIRSSRHKCTEGTADAIDTCMYISCILHCAVYTLYTELLPYI
jgi:hypothetical protein